MNIDVKSNSTGQRSIGRPEGAMEKRQYSGPTRHAIRGTVFIRLTGYADGCGYTFVSRERKEKEKILAQKSSRPPGK